MCAGYTTADGPDTPSSTAHPVGPGAASVRNNLLSSITTERAPPGSERKTDSQYEPEATPRR